jgi:hypothetical protein
LHLLLCISSQCSQLHLAGVLILLVSGVNNAFSRIGGLLSPFAVNAAHAPGIWTKAPEAIFAALSLVAAASVWLLPPDKKGQALEDTIDDIKVAQQARPAAAHHHHNAEATSSDSDRATTSVGDAVRDVDVVGSANQSAMAGKAVDQRL